MHEYCFFFFQNKIKNLTYLSFKTTFSELITRIVLLMQWSRWKEKYNWWKEKTLIRKKNPIILVFKMIIFFLLKIDNSHCIDNTNSIIFSLYVKTDNYHCIDKQKTQFCNFTTQRASHVIILICLSTILFIYVESYCMYSFEARVFS